MITRRDFSFSLACASLFAGPLMALGEASKTRVGLLKVGPDWNARPEALRRLMWETQKRTSIEVAGDASKVVVGEAMFETPLLVWRGENAFAPLGENERALLSRYLRFGGLIWVDAANPKCGFVKSIERELDAILPNAKAEALSPEHVLYKSFFLLDHAYGRHDDDVKVLGVNVNERAALLMTFCDVLGANERDKIGTWRFECTPGGQRQRERALRFGVNVLMYATCLDYKADQVHIPFIMKKKRR